MQILISVLLWLSGLLMLACGSGGNAPQSTRQSTAEQPQQQEQTAAEAQAAPQLQEPEVEAAAAETPTDQRQAQTEDELAQAEPQDTADEEVEAQVEQLSNEQVDEEDQPLLTYLPRDATHTEEGIEIIRDNYRPSDIGRNFSTTWGIRIIDTDELRVGAPRDAIPALTNPLYLTMAEATELYEHEIPVVQVRIGEDARAFPLGILIWHEIVNDTINGQPVAVTFCPLCNTAIVYTRQVGERTLDFAVSGLLRNSDLVMYDRNTETLWQQSTGRAIVGNLVGVRLQGVPATIVSFGQFRAAFPDGLVLSEETGWFRSYGQNPYVHYDSPDQRPFLYDGELDDRLPAKLRVVSVETPGGDEIAYPWPFVADQRVVYDTHDETPVVLLWTPGTKSALDEGIITRAEDIGATAIFERELDGQLLSFTPNAADGSGQTFIDNETGSTWDIFGRAIAGGLLGSELRPVIFSDHFWFAWRAFHPDTEIVETSDPA